MKQAHYVSREITWEGDSPDQLLRILSPIKTRREGPNMAGVWLRIDYDKKIIRIINWVRVEEQIQEKKCA